MQSEPLIFQEIKMGDVFEKGKVIYRKETNTLAIILRWEDGEKPSQDTFQPFSPSELVTVFKNFNSDKN